MAAIKGSEWQSTTDRIIDAVSILEHENEHRTLVIFVLRIEAGYSGPTGSRIQMMNFLAGIFSLMPLRWWIALIVFASGIAAICLRVLETDRARAKRPEQKRKNELRLLADKISVYGNSVHRRYPTGDVIVGERDLAEQLRKRPDAVVTALDLLLNEQKVQRAPLNGYWKLNA